MSTLWFTSSMQKFIMHCSIDSTWNWMAMFSNYVSQWYMSLALRYVCTLRVPFFIVSCTHYILLVAPIKNGMNILLYCWALYGIKGLFILFFFIYVTSLLISSGCGSYSSLVEVIPLLIVSCRAEQ